MCDITGKTNVSGERRDSLVSLQRGVHLEKYMQNNVAHTYRNTMMCVFCRECPALELKPAHVELSLGVRCGHGKPKNVP